MKKLFIIILIGLSCATYDRPPVPPEKDPKWKQWPRPQQKRWQELKKQGIIIPGPVTEDQLWPN